MNAKQYVEACIAEVDLCFHTGEGHGNPLQYSCLEIPLDRGAWLATVHRIAELDTTEAT